MVSVSAHACRRAEWTFLLALTIGLLVFLLVDGAHEGFEAASMLPESFQGAVLFVTAAAVAVSRCSRASARG